MAQINLNEKFRAFIREKREETKITTRELDTMVFGKQISYTNNFENGRKQMTLETASKFLEALDYDIVFVKKTKD